MKFQKKYFSNRVPLQPLLEKHVSNVIGALRCFLSLGYCKVLFSFKSEKFLIYYRKHIQMHWEWPDSATFYTKSQWMPQPYRWKTAKIVYPATAMADPPVHPRPWHQFRFSNGLKFFLKTVFNKIIFLSAFANNELLCTEFFRNWFLLNFFLLSVFAFFS